MNPIERQAAPAIFRTTWRRLIQIVVLFTASPAAFAQSTEIGPGDNLEAAVAALTPGDELVLRGGTYNFNENVTLTANGTAAEPIVVRAKENERPVITQATNQQNVVEVRSSSYLVLRGIAFTGGSHGIRLMDSDYVTIEECEVYETGDVAISANSGGTYEGLKILRNHIHHTNATGEGMTEASTEPEFEFLKGLSTSRKRALLGQLRDLWTHTSTAVEGNTLTLGDTHFVLEEGLTISGKPIKDHQEVIGHARAIDILYRSLTATTDEQTVFDLHKSVQADTVIDIYKPNGAWKLEPNGTYTVTRDNRQVYVEYAAPGEVPHLMREILAELNAERTPQLTLETAPEICAKIHAGIAHTHPFWDGNGRIARLLSNIPLLRAGLPPIVIPAEQRQLYVQLLAEYELAVGTINRSTGVWPKPDLLAEFMDGWRILRISKRRAV